MSVSGPLWDDVTSVVRPVTPDDYTNSFSDNAFFGFISISVTLKQAKTLLYCTPFMSEVGIWREEGHIQVGHVSLFVCRVCCPKLPTRIVIKLHVKAQN